MVFRVPPLLRPQCGDPFKHRGPLPHPSPPTHFPPSPPRLRAMAPWKPPVAARAAAEAAGIEAARAILAAGGDQVEACEAAADAVQLKFLSALEARGGRGRRSVQHERLPTEDERDGALRKVIRAVRKRVWEDDLSVDGKWTVLNNNVPVRLMSSGELDARIAEDHLFPEVDHINSKVSELVGRPDAAPTDATVGDIITHMVGQSFLSEIVRAYRRGGGMMPFRESDAAAFLSVVALGETYGGVASARHLWPPPPPPGRRKGLTEITNASSIISRELYTDVMRKMRLSDPRSRGTGNASRDNLKNLCDQFNAEMRDWVARDAAYTSDDDQARFRGLFRDMLLTLTARKSEGVLFDAMASPTTFFVPAVMARHGGDGRAALRDLSSNTDGARHTSHHADRAYTSIAGTESIVQRGHDYRGTLASPNAADKLPPAKFVDGFPGGVSGSQTAQRGGAERGGAAAAGGDGGNSGADSARAEGGAASAADSARATEEDRGDAPVREAIRRPARAGAALEPGTYFQVPAWKRVPSVYSFVKQVAGARSSDRPRRIFVHATIDGKRHGNVNAVMITEASGTGAGDRNRTYVYEPWKFDSRRAPKQCFNLDAFRVLSDRLVQLTDGQGTGDWHELRRYSLSSSSADKLASRVLRAVRIAAAAAVGGNHGRAAAAARELDEAMALAVHSQWFLKPFSSKAAQAGIENEPKVLDELAGFLHRHGAATVTAAHLNTPLVAIADRPWLTDSVDGLMMLEKGSHTVVENNDYAVCEADENGDGWGELNRAARERVRDPETLSDLLAEAATAAFGRRWVERRLGPVVGDDADINVLSDTDDDEDDGDDEDNNGGGARHGDPEAGGDDADAAVDDGSDTGDEEPDARAAEADEAEAERYLELEVNGAENADAVAAAEDEEDAGADGGRDVLGAVGGGRGEVPAAGEQPDEADDVQAGAAAGDNQLVSAAAATVALAKAALEGARDRLKDLFRGKGVVRESDRHVRESSLRASLKKLVPAQPLMKTERYPLLAAVAEVVEKEGEFDVAKAKLLVAKAAAAPGGRVRGLAAAARTVAAAEDAARRRDVERARADEVAGNSEVWAVEVKTSDSDSTNADLTEKVNEFGRFVHCRYDDADFCAVVKASHRRQLLHHAAVLGVAGVMYVRAQVPGVIRQVVFVTVPRSVRESYIAFMDAVAALACPFAYPETDAFRLPPDQPFAVLPGYVCSDAVFPPNGTEPTATGSRTASRGRSASGGAVGARAAERGGIARADTHEADGGVEIDLRRGRGELGNNDAGDSEGDHENEDENGDEDKDEDDEDDADEEEKGDDDDSGRVREGGGRGGGRRVGGRRVGGRRGGGRGGARGGARGGGAAGGGRGGARGHSAKPRKRKRQRGPYVPDAQSVRERFQVSLAVRLHVLDHGPFRGGVMLRPGPAAAWNRLKVGVDTVSKFLAKAKIGQPYPQIQGFSLLRIFKYRMFNAYRADCVVQCSASSPGNRLWSVHQFRRRISRSMPYLDWLSVAAAELRDWSTRLKSAERAADEARWAEQQAAAAAAAALQNPRTPPRRFQLAVEEGEATPPAPRRTRVARFSSDERLKRMRLNSDRAHRHDFSPSMFGKGRPCALCTAPFQSIPGRKRHVVKSGCETCNISLCQFCFRPWHTVGDLTCVEFDGESMPIVD